MFKRLLAKKILLAGVVLLSASVFMTTLTLQKSPAREFVQTTSTNQAKTEITQPEVLPQEQSTQVSAQQTTTTQETVSDPAPTVTNPYTEGSNLWHAFNVRTQAGLTTPEGSNSDVMYSQGKTLSRTPTQWAIVFTGVKPGVAGVVETINQDGSLVISCTNCGGGWNVRVEKNVAVETVSSLRFLE